MRDDSETQDILKLLGDLKDEPLTATEISGRLELRGGQRKRLQKVLNEMVAEGSIVVLRENRYSLGREADLITGILQVVRSGNGYVARREGERGQFVPAENLGTALPGDRVVARLERDPVSERTSARIIRILERRRRDIVGTLRSTGRFLYVVPMDASYGKDFLVPDAKGAQCGDRVVMRFVDWASRHVNPEGEVVEVLGPADNPGTDTIAVIRHHDLREEFPPAVLRDAEEVSALAEKPGPRLDLRRRLIVTIDPLRARDFDDALSLERDAQGRRVLGVHIADVSHYVRPGSELDREAVRRGNSVYLPDHVLPMLPEQLSNGVCSLRPDEDRLTFSVFITYDETGAVVGREYARSQIRSHRRFTYEEVMALLKEHRPAKAGAARGARKAAPAPATPPPAAPDAATLKLLLDLNELAQQLRRGRFARYALELDMPECEIVLDAEGLMVDVRTLVNDESHQLVEECMVAANEAVSQELHHRGFAQIARLHEPPDEEKIEDLTVELASLGFEPGPLLEQRRLAEFLRSVAGAPLEYHVRLAVLKSMKRAVYSAEGNGHFGLAKKYYAHFTSPIRRYTDLIVHRQLGALLAATPPPYNRSELIPIAEQCTQTEYTAERAEKDIEEIKKYRFLAQQIEEQRPRTYAAAITRVMNFGLFVDVADLQLTGMVHVSALSDSFVRFDQRAHRLHAGKRVFTIGDRVQVYPASVDFDSRRIDFGIVLEGSEAAGGGRRRPKEREAKGVRR